MLRLAADENLHSALIRGLARRVPGLDLVRVQDAGLSGADDATVLAWAAEAGRILLTHDLKTIPAVAYARVSRGEPMPGVIAIAWTAPLGPLLDDLALALEASEAEDWQGRIEYLPF